MSVTTQGKNLGSTMNAATLITANANTIMQQPDITLDELKKLPEHQEIARKHCDDWLKNIWPSIIRITTDIIDYANTFNSSYESLVGLVDKLKSGDAKAKEEFSQVLTEVLLPALKEKKTKSAKVASDTLTLKANFEVDYQNFSADRKDATKAYTSKGGELDTLNTQLDGAKARVRTLGKELIDICIVEGVLLGALAVVSVFTEGADTSLIDGVVAIGNALESQVGREYSAAVKTESGLMNKIAALKEQLHYLNTVGGQLDGFKQYISAAVTASQDVADGWTTLTNEITDLVSHLKKISPKDAAVVITTQLSTSKAAWGDVLQQAKVLAPSGRIPVKNYKGMESFLADITPKQGA